MCLHQIVENAISFLHNKSHLVEPDIVLCRLRLPLDVHDGPEFLLEICFKQVAIIQFYFDKSLLNVTPEYFNIFFFSNVILK